MVSSRHFQVLLEGRQHYLLDLRSTNGTYVNGRRIQTAPLADGDQIDAGGTCFIVRIPYFNADESEQDTEPARPLAIDANYNRSFGASSPSTGTIAAPTSGLVVNKSRCGSGLTRLRGTIPNEESIAGILERLRGLGSFYFIVDFSRMGAERPPEVDAVGSSLFSWLPLAAASQYPQVVSMAEIGDWKNLVEEGWGSDAIVCLQSDMAQLELISKLRDLALGSAKPGDITRTVTGFCWPSVMSALLENDAQSFSPRFMSIAHAVVTEVAGEAEAWQLFGSEETIEKCRKFGLIF